MPEQEDTVNLQIAVDDDHIDRLDEVVRRLKDAGMRVEYQGSITGVVTGSIAADKYEGLRDIEGVVGIERSHDYQLPPPDSPIQ